MISMTGPCNILLQRKMYKRDGLRFNMQRFLTVVYVPFIVILVILCCIYFYILSPSRKTWAQYSQHAVATLFSAL